MEQVLNADVVCWATPIYYYEMSGQMKTLIDRMNAMYPKDYRFRDIYLLATASENEEETPKRAEMGLTGWIDCYPKSRLSGTLFCGGVTMPREIIQLRMLLHRIDLLLEFEGIDPVVIAFAEGVVFCWIHPFHNVLQF